MKPILLAGVIIVNFALLAYTLFIIQEHKKKRATKMLLSFLTVGVVLDVIATICMISGSENSPFSPHGILGYSSLGGMLLDMVLIWRFKLQNGSKVTFSKGLNLYSKIAYSWWILAFITGAILVASSK